MWPSLVILQALVALAWPASPSQGHPDPRVIVDVVRVRGPHDRADVEREARRQLWGKIVACYKPAWHKKPTLRGDATFELRVGADGDVGGVRRADATLKDEAVAACWAKGLRGLVLPKAVRGSGVLLRIYVAPGDGVTPESLRPRPQRAPSSS